MHVDKENKASKNKDSRPNSAQVRERLVPLHRRLSASKESPHLLGTEICPTDMPDEAPSASQDGTWGDMYSTIPIGSCESSTEPKEGEISRKYIRDDGNSIV